MKCILTFLTLMALSACASAQSPPADVVEAAKASVSVKVFDIWPGDAPGSEGWTQKEIEAELGFGPSKSRIVRNVVHPTLTAYLPDPSKRTGAAVVVAPGGGFMMLSIDGEGHQVAAWLAERGITAFVLKYRLVETPPDQSEFVAKLTSMLAGVAAAGEGGSSQLLDRALLGAADATQALRVVRANAAEWGYAPDHVGLLGFSAGAFITTHVAASADVSSRPDFIAPIYGGAFEEAAGVPASLPPMFVAVAQDDQLLAEATIKMVAQVQAAGHKPTFHLYASGGHGFGMNKQGKASDHWIDEFYWWMQEKGWLKPNQ